MPDARDRLKPEQLRERLARQDVRAIELSGRRHAAVAVAVTEAGFGADVPGTPVHAQWSDATALLLTRRAAGLSAHAGQWAMPGGRIDDGETPEAAALRELVEEVGLPLSDDAVCGRLDDYATRSGYVITPMVFWGGADPAMTPQEDEVLSVHRIAFRELCREDSPRFVDIPESPRPVVQVPVGGDLIHAPTGAVLVQFRRVAIEGTCERVHEYEQPVFAWR